MDSQRHSWNTPTSGHLRSFYQTSLSAQALCWLRPCCLLHTPPMPFYLSVNLWQCFWPVVNYMDALGQEISSIYLCSLGNVYRVEGGQSGCTSLFHCLSCFNLKISPLGSYSNTYCRDPHIPRNLGAHLAIL